MTQQILSFFFPFLCLILSLCFPEACTEGVSRGLDLALTRALPALFPALVLSSLLPQFWPAKGRRSLLFLPLFVGLFCGFPMGSAVVSDLKKRGFLTQKEGERMLLFASNAGPAFLLSFCGNQVLQNQRAGLLLFLSQSALALFLFLLFFARKKERPAPEPAPSLDFAAAFSGALKSAANSFLSITSCVLFFSFLSALVGRLFPAGRLLSALFFEITGGIGGLAAFPFAAAFPLCALGCGWGGLSVLMQTACVLEGSGLRLRFSLYGRLLFAAFLSGLALFFGKVL